MDSPSDAQRRAWMAQWRSAGPALERIRLEELASADLARIAADLEDASIAAARDRALTVSSGLIMQQQLFHGRRDG